MSGKRFPTKTDFESIALESAARLLANRGLETVSDDSDVITMDATLLKYFDEIPMDTLLLWPMYIHFALPDYEEEVKLQRSIAESLIHMNIIEPSAELIRGLIRSNCFPIATEKRIEGAREIISETFENAESTLNCRIPYTQVLADSLLEHTLRKAFDLPKQPTSVAVNQYRPHYPR